MYEESLHSFAELDSHADHSILGADAVVLEEYVGEKFRVYGYREEDGFIERHLVKAVVAYDDMEGHSTLLFFDQVFVDETMNHHLILPNQLRAFGISVYDTPRRYDRASKHAIIVGEDELIIPLQTRGYVSGFPVRKPSPEELEGCRFIVMTASRWDPYDPEFDNEERQVSSTSKVTSKISYPVEPKDLAKRWMVPLETARKTLDVTTILASRIRGEGYSHNHLGNRFRWLSRNHIEGRFFTDTFFGIPSLAGNSCVQIFTILCAHERSRRRTISVTKIPRRGRVTKYNGQ